jgi:acyl-CoA thioesterase-1
MLRGLPPAKMKENLDKIIQKAKEKNIKVLLCGMLAPPTLGSAYMRDFTNAFPDLAEKHKIAYMPFLLENVALQRDLNQADGIHPNARGTRIMVENIYRVLQPMLTK